MKQTEHTYGSPAELVAILVAARRAGFRDLERSVREKLKSQHSIHVRFVRPERRDQKCESRNANS